MSALLKMMAGGAEDKLYSDSVFAVALYTGNGSTQTITNGIDLAGKGGMVWCKARNGAFQSFLTDTARGNNFSLVPSERDADFNYGALSGFNSNGFGLTSSEACNRNTYNFVSWTFRKAPKFFDVVTYTGNGVAGRQIPHNLGVAPGMIVVKATSVAGQDWMVYHRSLTTNGYLLLNSTGAASTYPYVYDATDIDFKVASSAATNGNGTTYVAYLFAHDTSADGIIQCGSFTTSGGTYSLVNLGWEPQYLLFKSANSTGLWGVIDVMRGFSHTSSPYLVPNTADAEAAWDGFIAPTATGFMNASTAAFPSGVTYIYLAIRRPNKPPTSGTQVYASVAATGSGSQVTLTSGFPVDLSISQQRFSAGNAFAYFFDRLRGSTKALQSTAASAEADAPSWPILFDNNTGVVDKNYGSTTAQFINHFFRRAPGVFDVVCYTGNGSARTLNHSLGVKPEIMIAKARGVAYSWVVYHKDLGATKYVFINYDSSVVTNNEAWYDTEPTATQFTVAPNNYTSANGVTYVWYGFATCPGISKVGSYTGNGSSQTINCGFTTGARFVLIKRTDSTGVWFVWDSTRGIVAGNDPHLSLNTTAAEVTTDDSIDPANEGFSVNQLAATNINVNNATYIFLSFA